MKRFTVRELASAGLIASLYTVLSLVFMPISFGVYQVRIAEALTVLPFLTRAAIPGLYIGCLLANIIGGMGWLDIVFGSLITLVAAFLTRGASHLSGRRWSMILSGVPIVLMWSGAVYLLCGFVMNPTRWLGLAVSVAALVLAVLAERALFECPQQRLFERLSRILAVVGALVATLLLRTTTDTHVFLCGGIVLLATPVVTMMLTRMRLIGSNPSLLIAPLPPVLLNAFGVSLYLAPLLGFSYWFSVQMVGVGQLIACYLIGVPLLMALKRRNILN